MTNFSTFLLDRATGMLFMGARDAILALDTNNLQQPVKKVGRVCVCVEFIVGQDAEMHDLRSYLFPKAMRC